MTADSIHYQKELKKSGYEFNPDATGVMAHKLKQLLLSEHKNRNNNCAVAKTHGC